MYSATLVDDGSRQAGRLRWSQLMVGRDIMRRNASPVQQTRGLGYYDCVRPRNDADK